MYFYASALNNSLRQLLCVAAVAYFRYRVSWFSWNYEITKFSDPILLFFSILYAAYLVRKLIMKNIMLRLNRDSYTTKIEQLFYLDRLLKRLTDPTAGYSKYPKSNSGSGIGGSSLSNSLSSSRVNIASSQLADNGSVSTPAAAATAAASASADRASDRDKELDDGWFKQRVWEEYVIRYQSFACSLLLVCLTDD